MQPWLAEQLISPRRGGSLSGIQFYWLSLFPYLSDASKTRESASFARFHLVVAEEAMAGPLTRNRKHGERVNVCI